MKVHSVKKEKESFGVTVINVLDRFDTRSAVRKDLRYEQRNSLMASCEEAGVDEAAPVALAAVGLRW